MINSINSFRSKVALGQAITYSGKTYKLPRGMNMYDVQWNCDLESFAQTAATACAVRTSAAAKAYGAFIVGTISAIPRGQTIAQAVAAQFGQWVFKYNASLSTTALAAGRGLEGAQMLLWNDLHVGCSINRKCAGKQFISCAWKRTVSNPLYVYHQGFGCASNADCKLYPGICQPAKGTCKLNAPSTPYGRLTVKGKYITDPAGTPVALHGMSLLGTNNDIADTFYQAETSKQLKCAWNTNVIRAPLYVGNGTKENGGYVYKESIGKHYDRDRMERAIFGAVQHGLYVLVDWHGESKYMQTFEQQAKNYFGTIASKWGIFSNIIYETFNEPYAADKIWAWPEIKAYHTSIIATIRYWDKRNLVVVGTPYGEHGLDTATSSPIADTNLAYMLHFYPCTSSYSKKGVQIERAQAKNLAVFVTEYGTTDSSGRQGFCEPETKIWWSKLDAMKVSYINWAINTQEQYSSSAFKASTTSATMIGLDSQLTPSGALVKAKYKSQNNGVKC